MTHILDRFEPSPLTDLELLHLLSHFYNDPCTFVTGATGTEMAHLGLVPVIEHEVDVGEAEAGSIELDKDVVRA